MGYGYGQGGSGQQSVTCYPELDSSQSYWIVKCAVRDGVGGRMAAMRLVAVML